MRYHAASPGTEEPSVNINTGFGGLVDNNKD